MATASTAPKSKPPEEVVLISHSPIFYWWPVWLIGLLLAAFSALSGHVMVIVPAGTTFVRQGTVDPAVGGETSRNLIVLPPDGALAVESESDDPLQPRHRVAPGNGPGMIFTVTLCLVILITNVHLRGVWAVVAVLSVVILTGLLALLGWWDPILRTLGVLDIHINALGYLTISVFLLVVWLIAFFLFDRRNRLIFRQGQLRVREVIGGGERVYDTFGVAVEKQRDDPFRHWLLGLGSGDLTVRVAGSNAQTIEAPNVLRASRKLALINRMLQERRVVSERG